MKPCQLLFGLTLCLVRFADLPAAPPEGTFGSATADATPAIAPANRSHLRIFRPYSGNQILVVNYPWRQHARASIEVQWLAEGEPEPANTRPLGFVAGYVKGDVGVDVERCRTAGENLPTTIARSKGDLDFEINAKRNSLGVSAAWVDFHWKRPDAKTETRSAFCLLESWALDGRTLYLDLPPRFYDQPGKLRLWMLRGKDTVWLETIPWPGMPGAVDEMPPASVVQVKPGDRKPTQGGKTGEGAKPAAGEKTAPAAKPAPAKAAKPAKKADEGTADADDPFAAPKPKKKE